MAIREEFIEELIKGYEKHEDLLGEKELLKELTKRLLEKALQGELTHHLGYPKWSPDGKNTGNSRNGKNRKKLKGEFGEMEIEVPRDRNGEFDPVIIPKGQTCFDGFDKKIMSLFARGMSTREIRDNLKEIYQIEVSPEFISSVTDSVMEDVREWQNRPLNSVYQILYLDALMVKVKTQGHIVDKAVYLAVGVTTEGRKEVLDLWIEKTEGAEFWLQMVNKYKNRGVKDIFIAYVDGIKGLTEAISTIFPKTEIHLITAHMVWRSIVFASWKHRKALYDRSRGNLSPHTFEMAEKALDILSRKRNN
jgi:putative transposase